MNVKKWLLAVVMLVPVLSMTACAETVLTYEIGGERKRVTYNDVEELVEFMALNHPQYIQDVDMLKNVLFAESRASRDIILFEELQGGLTNAPEFVQSFEMEVARQHFTYVAMQGTNWVARKTRNIPVSVARASHILFAVEPEQSREEVRLLAGNTLESLKQSRNLARDFSNAAAQYSRDPGSQGTGGDLGYFIGGMMVPPFEAAVFGTRRKGLVPEVVETDFGFHLIYVTKPKAERPYSWVERRVNDGEMSQHILMTIQQDIQQHLIDMAVENKYTFSNNRVVIGGTEYDIFAIPENADMFSVWGRNYTWRDVTNLFGLFVPGYADELATQFDSIMMAAKSFLINFEGGRRAGRDNDAARRTVREEALMQYAMSSFERNLQQQAGALVTDQDVRDFYERNKAQMVRNGQTMPFDELLRDQIRSHLVQQHMGSFYQSWLMEKKATYKVTFDQNGLNNLIRRANRLGAQAAAQGR